MASLLSSLTAFLPSSISFAEKIPVFDKERAQRVVQFFDNQRKVDYWPEERLKRWELKKEQLKEYEQIDPHDRWFPITFDSNGKIFFGEISQQYIYTKNYPTLQEATTIAVEAMAKKLHWEGQTHLMGMSLVQYQMVAGEKYGMHFHQDASRYTMTILLNDETGWTGGDLLFRSMSFNWIQQTIHYKQGYGILFTNEGKQHSVTEMTPVSNKMTERTIMTVHEKYPLLDDDVEMI
ncbi:MAG: hypothetical protein L0207_05485 [Chlamydiae bacterium]|nr:hypothetical protein [Chlamydiota bacterium]